jgi:hypothetical protein
MNLRPVGFVGGRELARTWTAVVGLALLIGLVGAVVLAATAGARRTASALDRFLETTATPDARVILNDREAARSLQEELTEQSFVEATALLHSTPLFDAEDPSGDAYLLGASGDATYGTSVDHPLLLEGRLPDPTSPDEVLVTDTSRVRRDIDVGDELVLISLDQAAIDCTYETDCTDLPGPGPTLELRVVGVYRDLVSAQAQTHAVGQELRSTPAFVEQWDGEVGVFPPDLLVRLHEDAAGVPELRAFVDDRYPPGGDVQAVVVDAEDDKAATAADAVDAYRPALIAFALVAGLAGLVAVEQAVSRHVAAATGPLRPTRALGMSRAQQATAIAVPVTVAAILGAGLAVAGAVALSSRFPIGATRVFEPDPGVRVDLPVLVAGAAAIVAVVVAWGWVVAHHRTAGRPRRRPVRPAWIPGAVARAGASPALVEGSRLSFERGDRRTTLPVRSALVGAVMGVAGIVAAAVVPVSVDGVLADPTRWGQTYSRFGALVGDRSAEELLTELGEEDGVEATAEFLVGDTRLAGRQVSGTALDDVTGTTGYTILRGRAPAEDDEVVLGEITARQLDRGVGSTVAAAPAAGGEPVELEVVGTAAFPNIIGARPGQGAGFTPAGLAAVAIGGTNSTPVIRYDGRLTEEEVDALDARLLREHSFAPESSNRPLSLVNMREARVVWWALMAFFAVLTLVALVHALASTLRTKRVEFAVLQSLGYDRGQVRRGIGWQAVLITVAVGTVLGIPLGLVGGRILWDLIAGDLGVVDTPTTPTAVLAVLVPVALVATLAVAAPAAWSAARRRPGRALATE